jgi:hypothetical protein
MIKLLKSILTFHFDSITVVEDVNPGVVGFVGLVLAVGTVCVGVVCVGLVKPGRSPGFVGDVSGKLIVVVVSGGSWEQVMTCGFSGTSAQFVHVIHLN